MLMAAGLGTRLRPFTDERTKALMPVMGIPVAQFALDLAAGAGVTRVVANVHHRAEETVKGLRALDRGSASLEISDESAELLGSAGGYRKALPLLGGTFIALNADVLCNVDLHALYRAHKRLRARWNVALTLAVFRHAPAGEKYRRIVVDTETGLVRELVMQAEESPPFWAGVAVIEPEALDGVPEGKPGEFVPLVLKPMIERAKVGAYVTQGHWHDIGSPELWLRTHLALIAGLETGAIPRAWRLRIESAAHRLAQGTWVANPGFPRAVFGPEGVMYGPGQAPGRGIGFSGTWLAL
jgi:NDP-sugar pyrophosphorylase family protein